MENLKNRPGFFEIFEITGITILIVLIIVGGISVWQKEEQRGEAIEGARDLSIKADMRALQTTAVRIYINEGNYVNVYCGGDPQIKEICENIKGYTPDRTIVSHATARAFCVQAPLNKPGAGYWCVDNTGRSVSITKPVCTALNVRCK